MTRAIFRTAWLAACLAVAGCAGPTIVEMPDDGHLVQVGGIPDRIPSTPATITSAAMQGDVLVLEVTFGGGCGQHDFALYASNVWLESDPVQVNVALAHDGHGDPCRALLSRELRFDLSPLAAAYRRSYGRGGTVVLRLREPGGSGAATHTVRYTF
ncbi:MAG TPA: hypothetical protein VGR37_21185 [Longimicrobiaceae bacterium]|nr:hypothetical protein [Longimicrobiaceae bacterium]